MSAGSKKFFDTNLLLYLLSADSAKAQRAEELVAQGGWVSVQVLNEFASVASRKLRMSIPEIRECLEPLRSICTVEPLTVETHARGLVPTPRIGGVAVGTGLVAAMAVRLNGLAGHDCVVLVTDHDAFDFEAIAAHARLLVDTRGRYPAGRDNVVKA